ncbi:hypothetical protein D3C85_1107750 [compost metagenome]
MSFLLTRPASYKIAVESFAVETTAATLNNGLPLYNVISKAPLKVSALRPAILIMVWLP